MSITLVCGENQLKWHINTIDSHSTSDMSWSVILGIIAIVLSPLTVIGMIVDDGTYWLIMDIVVIIVLPIIGIKLIKK